MVLKFPFVWKRLIILTFLLYSCIVGCDQDCSQSISRQGQNDFPINSVMMSRNFVDLLSFLEVPWISNLFPEQFVQVFGSQGVQDFLRGMWSTIQDLARRAGSAIMYMSRHFALHDECMERFICDLVNMPRNFDDLKRRESHERPMLVLSPPPIDSEVNYRTQPQYYERDKRSIENDVVFHNCTRHSCGAFSFVKRLIKNTRSDDE